eukprot:PLAT11927.1.p1 GENE.PLAT11927.1~~PLAT11927.1.p1  ORF type:complete len:1443 (-),score=464.96 PLAT11927.1:154-4482(-)
MIQTFKVVVGDSIHKRRPQTMSWTFVLTALLVARGAAGAAIFVDPGVGFDGPTCGSSIGQAACASLGAAVAASRSGDIILLQPGSYEQSQPVVVDGTDLHIMPLGGGFVELTMAPGQCCFSFFHVISSTLAFEDITFNGARAHSGAVMNATDSSITMTRCTVTSCVVLQAWKQHPEPPALLRLHNSQFTLLSCSFGDNDGETVRYTADSALGQPPTISLDDVVVSGSLGNGTWLTAAVSAAQPLHLLLTNCSFQGAVREPVTGVAGFISLITKYEAVLNVTDSQLLYHMRTAPTFYQPLFIVLETAATFALNLHGCKFTCSAYSCQWASYAFFHALPDVLLSQAELAELSLRESSLIVTGSNFSGVLAVAENPLFSTAILFQDNVVTGIGSLLRCRANRMNGTLTLQMIGNMLTEKEPSYVAMLGSFAAAYIQDGGSLGLPRGYVLELRGNWLDRSLGLLFFSSYSICEPLVVTIEDNHVSNCFLESAIISLLVYPNFGRNAASNALIAVRNNVIQHNNATGFLAGAMLNNSSVIFRDNQWVNNTSFDSGGVGVALEVLDAANTTVTIDNDVFLNNKITGRGGGIGSGGAAIAVTFPDLPPLSNDETSSETCFLQQCVGGGCAPLQIGCVEGLYVRQYAPHVTLVITNATMHYNQASCPTCVGGAVLLAGGSTVIRNSSIVGNRAAFFGGAIYVNGVSASLLLQSTQLDDNDAKLRGTTLMSQAGGMLFLQDMVANIGSGASAFDVSSASQVELARTQVQCPPGSNLQRTSFVYTLQDHIGAYITSVLDIGCNACPNRQYALRGGFTTVEETTTVTCHDCPYGAVCPGGGKVDVLPGFWLLEEGDELSSLVCPSGYCCATKEECKVDPCRGNRVGRLCGTCREGYTAALGTPICRPIAACHSEFFWPLAIVLPLLYAAWMLFSPLGSLSVADKHFYASVVKVLFYYYQIARLLVLTDPQFTGGGLSVVLFSIFGFRFHFSHPGGRHDSPAVQTDNSADYPGECPLPGLSATTDTMLQMAEPVMVMLALAVLFFGERVYARCRPLKEDDLPKEFVYGIDAGDGGHDSIDFDGDDADRASMDSTDAPPPPESQTGLHDDMQGALQRSLLNRLGTVKSLLTPLQSPGAERLVRASVRGKAGLHALRMGMHVRRRLLRAAHYSRAFAMLVMLSYFDLLEPVLKLLTCVTVRGKSYLYLDATQDCDIPLRPWLLVLLLFVLLPFPLTLIWLRRFADRLVNSGRWALHSAAFLFVVEKPYNSWAKWWESVFLARRLVLLCIGWLVGEPILRTYLLVVVCTLALVAHVYVRPFQSMTAQRLETVSLLALTLISILILRSATLAGVNVSSAGSVEATSSDRAVSFVLAVILPVPALLCMVIVPWRYWHTARRSIWRRIRRCRRRGSAARRSRRRSAAPDFTSSASQASSARPVSLAVPLMSVMPSASDEQ